LKGLQNQRCRAENGGVVAVFGIEDFHTLQGGDDAFFNHSLNIVDHQGKGGGDTAAQNDRFGVEKIDAVADAAADVGGRLSQNGFADGISLRSKYCAGLGVCIQLALCKESGKIGTLTASWTYAEEDNSTIIQLADRTLRILDDPEADIQLIDREGNVEKMWLGGIQTNKVQFESGIPAEFVDAVLTGRKPIATGHDGLMGVKIIECCLESARQGHNIRLV